MTGYLLQQHPVLEKPSFHPYPPIISLFHHTQVVSQRADPLPTHPPPIPTGAGGPRAWVSLGSTQVEIKLAPSRCFR